MAFDVAEIISDWFFPLVLHRRDTQFKSRRMDWPAPTPSVLGLSPVKIRLGVRIHVARGVSCGTDGRNYVGLNCFASARPRLVSGKNNDRIVLTGGYRVQTEVDPMFTTDHTDEHGWR